MDHIVNYSANAQTRTLAVLHDYSRNMAIKPLGGSQIMLKKTAWK